MSKKELRELLEFKAKVEQNLSKMDNGNSDRQGMLFISKEDVGS